MDRTPSSYNTHLKDCICHLQPGFLYHGVYHQWILQDMLAYICVENQSLCGYGGLWFGPLHPRLGTHATHFLVHAAFFLYWSFWHSVN